jgi:hypothetical protein
MHQEEARHERLARNQTLFREINRRLAALNAGFRDVVERDVYACECANVSCIQHVHVSQAEYAAVRRDARRFFVAPAEEHVFPEVEIVVDKTDRYWVVEKQGVAAELTAPERSRSIS